MSAQGPESNLIFETLNKESTPINPISRLLAWDILVGVFQRVSYHVHDHQFTCQIRVICTKRFAI